MMNSLPSSVIDALVTVAKSGAEAILKIERNQWVVIANNRKLITKEKTDSQGN